MDIKRINSQKEFQDICQKKFDGFRAKYSIGYLLAGFPSNNLYKGINCTHVIESYTERDLLLSSEYYILREQGNIKEDEHAAILPVNSDERFYGIIGNDKYIMLDFTMDKIYMKQATADGVYFAEFITSPIPHYLNKVYFYSNEDILNYAEEIGFKKETAKSKFDIIKFRFAHDQGEYLGDKLPFGWERLPSLKLNLSTEKPTDEFAMLANKMYRKGLPYVAELAKNGEPLEITDEDRKFYETSSEVIEERTAPIEEQIQDKEQDTTLEPAKEKTPVQENTGISNLEEAIDSLRNLKSMGIELTDSQEDLVSAYDRLIGKLNSQKFMWYYEKLNSDEFQQYKDSTQEREERLQTVREDITREEAARKEWYVSPENPSNIRNGQIQTMSNQLEALNNVSKFMPLADAQEESRRELETFFDMKEQADAEDHTLDSAMSDNIRAWYQDEYDKQEIGGKAK